MQGATWGESTADTASYAPAEPCMLFELFVARAASCHYTDNSPQQRTWRAPV
jgi:hypothetical protein